MICTHPSLRTFTFSNGKTIQSCSDCDTFDAVRRDVLGTNPPKYHGGMEYVISGAPSLHSSEVLSPDVSGFVASARQEEQYNNDPRILQAFRLRPAVFNTIYKKVLPHAASPTLARELANEVLSDVWCEVIKHINEFRNESSLKTWLISIALHMASHRIDYLHAEKRDGETLSDFVVENEDGEREGDAYPDAKQDRLVGFGSGTHRKFVYRDDLSLTATEQVMQIDAAMENGEPVSPTERRILRDWVLSNLREIQLRELHRLLPRKTATLKVPEPFIMKKGQRWSPLKGWAPESREEYLEFCLELTKRRSRNVLIEQRVGIDFEVRLMVALPQAQSNGTTESLARLPKPRVLMTLGAPGFTSLTRSR